MLTLMCESVNACARMAPEEMQGPCPRQRSLHRATVRNLSTKEGSVLCAHDWSGVLMLLWENVGVHAKMARKNGQALDVMGKKSGHRVLPRTMHRCDAFA